MWGERTGKYNATRTSYNDRKFASKKEANHAVTLDLLRVAKDPSQRVEHVEYQYRFPILINGVKVCDYICDFYVTFADGHKEIQEVKGMRTAVYKLKKKLVEATYGQSIIEF
jgi:Protein of unknown function (DUF1064)